MGDFLYGSPSTEAFFLNYCFNPLSPINVAHKLLGVGSFTGDGETTRDHIPKEK